MRSDYSDAIRLFRNDVAYPQIESRMQDGEQEMDPSREAGARLQPTARAVGERMGND